MLRFLLAAALALLPLGAWAANIDVGLTGTPAAMVTALAARGFQVNADGTVSVIDPTLNAAGLTVTGYRVLDGTAYVLVRTPAAIAVPPGLTVVSPEVRAAISGVFLWDTPPPPPTVISVGAFFNRFTAAEKALINAGLATHPAWAPALVAWALGDSVDLSAPLTTTRLTALVTGGALTAARATTIGTP